MDEKTDNDMDTRNFCITGGNDKTTMEASI